MDALITGAAHALAAGDPLGALNRVALRSDASALALRGIAMAQLGDLPRARELLRGAARAFGPKASLARARCRLAEAEIALVSRDLGWPGRTLDQARATLEDRGDRVNAAYAQYLQVRHCLLTGRLDEAERRLADIDSASLAPAARVSLELVVAGIALRRIRTRDARAALDRAREAAEHAGIPALMAELETVEQTLKVPAARQIRGSGEDLLLLEDVEALLASDSLLVDACRHVVRSAGRVVSLESRPVLFSLVRALGEAWPADVPRDTLIAGAFRTRQGDESHRARLRVEIGRLRQALAPLADIRATSRGFALVPRQAPDVVVLARPVEEKHATLLALLADGEAWSSSALALALGVSQRSVQRALDALAEAGKVQGVGRGRARRWTTPSVPGFPTILLLPAPLPTG